MWTMSLIDLCAICAWEVASAEMRDHGKESPSWSQAGDDHRNVMRNGVRRALAKHSNEKTIVDRAVKAVLAVRDGIDEGISHDRIFVVFHNISSEDEVVALFGDNAPTRGSKPWDHSVRVAEACE